jgi:NADPH2:quinone reductase
VAQVNDLSRSLTAFDPIMANELFEVVKSGAVKIEVHQTYPLKDAAKAHADLAARKTTGSTVLTV